MNALLEPLRSCEGGEVAPVHAWRLRGSCRGLDPRVFFPPPDDDSAAAEAKAICGACPVRRRCAEFALATREKHGVWGGLTERERRRLLRQRRRSA